MKKIITLVAVVLVTFAANAQTADSTKLFQAINGGGIISCIASTTFTNAKQPFTLGTNLSANVTAVTPKTYHSLLYGFGNNSLTTLNGYFLTHNWDTYIIYSRTLNAPNNYLALGIEKMVKAGDLKCFLITELGTNLSGKKILSFGILLSVQNKLWKRK